LLDLHGHGPLQGAGNFVDLPTSGEQKGANHLFSISFLDQPPSILTDDRTDCVKCSELGNVGANLNSFFIIVYPAPVSLCLCRCTLPTILGFDGYSVLLAKEKIAISSSLVT
jgi:hypothetical protein